MTATAQMPSEPEVRAATLPETLRTEAALVELKK